MKYKKDLCDKCNLNMDCECQKSKAMVLDCGTNPGVAHAESASFKRLRTRPGLVRSANSDGNDQDHGAETGSDSVMPRGLSRHALSL